MREGARAGLIGLGEKGSEEFVYLSLFILDLMDGVCDFLQLFVCYFLKVLDVEIRYVLVIGINVAVSANENDRYKNIAFRLNVGFVILAVIDDFGIARFGFALEINHE